MKVLITGINGLLGKDIAKIFLASGKYQVYGIGRAECKNKKVRYEKLDLMDYDSLNNVLNHISPDILIHCAAYTKLDDCEKNQEYAKKMNAEVTEFLARSAKYFIYISSDAVFSGKKGNYHKDDASDAINYYGYTKYLGEIATLKCKKSLIIRSSIYGYNLNENQSIAEWGIRNLLAQIDINGFQDVIFNPLYSLQLAQSLLYLVENQYTGVIHLGSKQTISKYDFFRKLAKMLGVDERLVHAISVDSVSFYAARTKNTSLHTEDELDYLNRYCDLDEGMRQLISDLKKDRRI